MFKVFEHMICCIIIERFFALLSYIVYCNALEFLLGTCLRSTYVGLLQGQNIEMVEMFPRVDVSKSVGARML